MEKELVKQLNEENDGLVSFLSAVYENLPKLSEDYAYIKLGQLIRPLTIYDDEVFWTLEYATNTIKYIRPQHLFADYQRCDVDYETIVEAPVKRHLTRAYANGEFASFINGKMMVGRLCVPDGYYRESDPFENANCRRILMDNRVFHFIAKKDGAAIPDYILRELLSDYVAEQAKQICLFRESDYLSSSDFFKIKIAVPSIDVQDQIINSEKQFTERFTHVIKVIDTYFDDDSKSDCTRNLVSILSSIAGATSINSHLYYNPLRVILEWMFRAARKQGLLHDKCFNNQDHINLTDSYLFMAGRPAINSGVICKVPHFPVLISNIVLFILEVTGGASHTTKVSEKEVPNLTSYWKKIDTPYLLYSLSFMLCDVIIWFGQYINEHPNVDYNKSLWRDLVLEGVVKKDKNGNLFVGDCFIPKHFYYDWSEGDYAIVKRAKENDVKDSPFPLVALKLD